MDADNGVSSFDCCMVQLDTTDWQSHLFGVVLTFPELGNLSATCLLDPGLKISCVNAQFYSRFQHIVPLTSTTHSSIGAGGKPLHILRTISLCFRVGSLCWNASFYVV